MANPLLESFGESPKASVIISSHPLANLKGKENPDLPSVFQTTGLQNQKYACACWKGCERSQITLLVVQTASGDNTFQLEKNSCSFNVLGDAGLIKVYYLQYLHEKLTLILEV